MSYVPSAGYVSEGRFRGLRIPSFRLGEILQFSNSETGMKVPDFRAPVNFEIDSMHSNCSDWPKSDEPDRLTA